MAENSGLSPVGEVRLFKQSANNAPFYLLAYGLAQAEDFWSGEIEQIAP